jgi:hypothetical protein
VHFLNAHGRVLYKLDAEQFCYLVSDVFSQAWRFALMLPDSQNPPTPIAKFFCNFPISHPISQHFCSPVRPVIPRKFEAFRACVPKAPIDKDG